MSNKIMRCFTYEILNNKRKCDKNYFKNVIENLLSNNSDVKVMDNGNKTLIFKEDFDDSYYSLELFKNVNNTIIPNNYLFFRVGRQKDFEGALKRNIITYAGKEIIDQEEQSSYELEICTYLLVDTATGIILELFGQFAPTVTAFINMINSLLADDKTLNTIEIVNNHIFTENMIESFKDGGSVLNRISYKYAMPNLEILNELGLDIQQVTALKDLDVFELQVTLKNKLRIPLTKNSQKIKYVINSFNNCRNDIKESLSFTGSTSTAKKKEYSFNEEEVTYNIEVNHTIKKDTQYVKLSLDEMAQEVYVKIIDAYISNRKDILSYI